MHTNRLSRRSVRTAVAASLVAALLVPAASIAQQRPQFRARVDVVQFQVRVTDADGAFVPGLTASDFALSVEGNSRPITSVYEVNLAAPAEDGETALPPAGWRQWILFFDAAFNNPRGVVEAQAAALDFVKNQLHERDLVGVATFNTVSGARLVVPLTRDREQVITAINGLGLNQATQNVTRSGFLASPILDLSLAEAGGVATGGNEPAGGGGPLDIAALLAEMAQQVRSLEYAEYSSVVAQYAEQMETVGQMLRTIRGRKHVVYFSQGFDDAVLTGQSLDQLTATTDAIQQDAGLALAQSSGDERFGSADVRASLDSSLDVFRSADAVIHVVDPSGLGGGRDRTSIGSAQTSSGDFNSRGGTRSALTSLADATGGQMHWETNDIIGAMSEIEEANRAYYVVAFARAASDGEVVALDVTVSRAGTTVDAPGELAAPMDFAAMSDIEKQLQLAEFVTKGITESDLVFDLATGAFYGDGVRNRLPVIVEVPWSQMEELASSGADSNVELEILSYVLDDQDRMVDFSSGEVSLNMEAMAGSGAAGLPFRYYDLLWAGPGERRVRTILRDKELGRISAVTSALAAVGNHAAGDVVVSGPIGVDWEHPGLIMRGFKAENPPPHKVDGPVAYPFNVGENEITPTAILSGTAGSDQYAYFVAHNLGEDAEGNVPTQVGMILQSGVGEQIPLAAQAIVANYYDAASDGLQMVVKATLPADLQPGYYELVIMVNDTLKEAAFNLPLPIWVTE
jgi:VWFA-related protein